MTRNAIVVTTINRPNDAMRVIRDAARALDAEFIVIGDTKSPPEFDLDGARFLSIDAQRALDFEFVKLCPTRHYARKNIGYLLAAQDGVDCIVETDDDNIPVAGFDGARDPWVNGETVTAPGWANVYKLFTDQLIWPRGLPLIEVTKPTPQLNGTAKLYCPIQQGLANENPDVDAIYRLTLPLPMSFDERAPVILGDGVWCPFNSQNTTIFRDAFFLTYLPYYCSFRMTDIWRSFVAQRLLWTCGWNVMFHSATVRQERNEHDLMKDFEDEIPGYMRNLEICDTLQGLPLAAGAENMRANIETCYQKLISIGVIGQEEEQLLTAWLDDMSGCLTGSH